MTDETENGTGRRSKKLVYGVGVNDADYFTQSSSGDINWKCNFYRAWAHILERAYSEKYHKTRPTYKNVTVCKKWHSFMNFRAWMQTQDWEGKVLDKDIIQPGNKIYSPDKCCFVNVGLNSLLTDSSSNRGNHPLGVSYHKTKNKFCASVSVNGKLKYLGDYKTPEAAHRAYCGAKYALIMIAADNQEDFRIKNGLIKHANLLGMA